MGLHIKQPWWLKTQGIVTLIAVFALAIQPVGGFVSSLVANAASEPKSVSMTNFDVQGMTANSAAIFFGMEFTGFTNPEAIDVYVEREDNRTVRKSIKSDIAPTINSKVTGYIYTKEAPGSGDHDNFKPAKSWERAVYKNGDPGYVQWTEDTRPTKAYAVVTANDGEKVTSDEIDFVEPAGFPYEYPAPAVTNVFAKYSVSDDYTGIYVGFHADQINAATDVELRIHDDDGDDNTYYSVKANPDGSVLSTVNNSNITPGTGETTGGTVLIQGERNSSSWTNQEGSWTGSSRPTHAEVVITMQDGSSVRGESGPIIQDASNGLTKEAAFSDRTAPEATVEVKGGNVVNGVRYVRPSDNIRYSVNATDTQSEIDRAANIVFKLLANEKTQNGVVCGSWHNGKYPAGASKSFTMNECNGGTTPADGPYGLGLRVYDTAGNKVRIPNQVFHVDGTKPTVSNFNIDNSSTTGVYAKKINVSAEASDTNLNNVKFFVQELGLRDGQPFCTGSGGKPVIVEGTLNSTTNRYEATLNTADLDGQYCVSVQAGDHAKNHSNVAGRQLVVIDNTAPKVTSVEMNEIRSYGGLNFTGSKLNSSKLAVTFTTDEPLKVSRSQVSLRIPALSNAAPATGWTSIQKVGENKYLANIDLVNSTNSSVNSNWKNFFKDKFYQGINLYFQLTDELDNNKNTYYAVDPATGNPIDGWTTNSGDERNYKFTLDNKAPELVIKDKDSKKLVSNNDSIIVKATDDSGIREIHANIRKVVNGSVNNEVVGGLKYEFDRSDVKKEVLHEIELDALVKDGIGGVKLESGEYELKASALDTVLNNSGQQIHRFTVNNQAPKAQITVDGLSSGEVTNNKNLAVKGVGVPSEYGTDIKTHYFELKTPSNTHNIYSFNNAAGKMCVLNGANECSFDLSDYNDGDGRYEIRYVVTDHQNHRNDGVQQPWLVGTEVVKFTFTVDTTPPVVSLDASLNGKTLQGPVAVKGSVSDAHPRHYWVQVKKDGNVITSETYTTHHNSSFTDRVLRTLNGDGDYQVTLAARDSVGGTDISGHRSGDVSITFTIDNTPPSAPVFTHSLVNGLLNITVEKAASDGGEGDPVTTIKDVNGIDIPFTRSGNVYTVDTKSMLKNTEIFVVATAKDLAGNERAANKTYKVDNGAPAIYAGTLSNDAEGIFTLNGTSGFMEGSEVTVVVDGAVYSGNTTAADGSWSVIVGALDADTTYTFNVAIVDRLNYSNTLSATYTTPSVESTTLETPGAANAAVFIPGETEPVEIAGGEATEPTVLGSEDSRVQGDSTKNTAALTPSEEGWKLFDTAWYWWLAALAAIIGFFWWLAGVIRRRQTQEV